MLRKISLLIIIGLLFSCSNKVDKRIHSFMALNTTCSVTVYNKEVDLLKVEEIVKSIEYKMSRYYEGSDISKINNLAGKNYFISDPETIYVIKKGIKYSEISNGKFDISIGPIVDVWRAGKSDVIPDKDDIEKALGKVSYKKIDINSNSVKLQEEGMSLDLGGIAKGYASDRIREYLVSEGVTSGLINLGGNIDLIGSKPDGSEWRIGIQHPRKSRGEYIGIISLSDKSFVSSGDYERFFIQDDIRYHHILDTRTGYPFNGQIVSSSIISTSSVDSDALSTITFSSTIEEIKNLREKVKFEGVFVTREKEVYITPNLRNIFILKDDRYRLIYN